MRRLVGGYLLLTLGGLAGERTVIINDEAGRRLAGAGIEAVLTPAEDPRLSSVVVRAGATDAAGRFRLAADDALILTRIRARHAGHFSADADHRHGLGRAAQPAELTLTLPRMTEGVPLHYREIRLTGLPAGRRIGFDAEAADAVAPWGKGRVSDFEFMIDSQQVGWTESPEILAELRRSAEGRRMDDQEWAESYGHFRGTLRVSFPRRGDGLRTSPAFWPYCRLKMPALAPAEGYEGERTLAFDTLPGAESATATTGYYLRLRSQLGAGDQPMSAHYAKIQGRIEAGPGRLAFRFYYN
ncbi:MAG: hypothetical protein RL749_707, partial [Verrucomicrobiota bacterium]